LDYHQLYKNLTDGSNLAFLADLRFLNSLLATPPNFVVLKEKPVNEHVGLVMETNNILFEAYNDKIVQLVESGITDNIWKNLNKKTQKAEKRKPEKPVALSLDHLQICFTVWGGLLLVAFVVFLAEDFIGRKKKKLANLHDQLRAFLHVDNPSLS
jgi:hypothetical protein